MVFTVSKTTKVVVIAVLLFGIYYLTSRGNKQINNPRVSGVALPDSNVCIDQKSVQIQVADRRWEVGFDVLSGQYDGKVLYGGRVLVRYKW